MRGLRFILLITLLMSSLPAQDDAVLRGHLKKITHGIRTSITSPELRGYWTVTGLGLLLSLPLDRQVKEYTLKHGLLSESLADFGYVWGGKWAAVGILPGIFLVETARGASMEERCQRLDFAFTSLATVGITTEILKYTLRRPRPNKQVLDFPYGYAFPSGHAAASFGVAEVIRLLYGNRSGALFYGLAVLTGLSRIHDNRHWLSDVVGGAGLAIGFVRGFHLGQKGDHILSIHRIWLDPRSFGLALGICL